MKSPPPVARLLVVDDSKEICQLIVNHYKLQGYLIEMASCAADAWKILVKDHFDIVISDIIMPGMKGTELLQKIKRHYPMIHVIMITGYVSLEHLLSCMRGGADTCIFKPLDNFSELDSAIDEALASKHRWEDKIVALKGLKEMNPQSFEILDDQSNEQTGEGIPVETVNVTE